jgi:hypothetical protein
LSVCLSSSAHAPACASPSLPLSFFVCLALFWNCPVADQLRDSPRPRFTARNPLIPFYQPAGRESRFSTRAPTLTNIRISQFYAAGNHFPSVSRSILSPAMYRRIYSAQYSHC